MKARGGVGGPEPVKEERNALLDLDARVVAQALAGFGDVGAGERHIAGLRGLAVNDCLFAQGRFQQLDEAAQGDSLRLAQIEDFIAEFLSVQAMMPSSVSVIYV